MRRYAGQIVISNTQDLLCCDATPYLTRKCINKLMECLLLWLHTTNVPECCFAGPFEQVPTTVIVTCLRGYYDVLLASPHSNSIAASYCLICFHTMVWHDSSILTATVVFGQLSANSSTRQPLLHQLFCQHVVAFLCLSCMLSSVSFTAASTAAALAGWGHAARIDLRLSDLHLR